MAGSGQTDKNSPVSATWKNENYLTVYGWMANVLKLTGNDLLVYALIHGFGEYKGSTKYIANSINASRRTVFNALENLIKRGLIVKKQAGRFCNYSPAPMQNLHTTSAEIAQIPMQNLHTTYANIAPHIDIDIYKDIDVDSGDVQKSGNQKQQTTNFINIIRESAKAQGFYITERQARAFQCLDPAWLSGDFNYLVFAADKIAGQDKSRADKERIFSKAYGYDNLLAEYPAWRAEREKSAEKKNAESEKRQRIGKARQNKPRTCRQCGNVLKGDECKRCDLELFFDEGKIRWVFRKPLRLANDFREMIARKNKRIPTA